MGLFDDPEIDWPGWVGEHPGLTAQLESLARTMRSIQRQRHRAMSSSELSREAEDIASDAKELLERVRRFHSKAWFDMIEHTGQTDALSVFSHLEEGDKALTQLGLSPYSLQHVLMGLKAHMEVIATRSGDKSGKPNNFAERWFCDELVQITFRCGAPLDRSAKNRHEQLFAAAVDGLNDKVPESAMLRISDTRAFRLMGNIRRDLKKKLRQTSRNGL